MTDVQTAQAARTLDQAFLGRCEIDRLTLGMPKLSLEDAYSIQDALLSLRKNRGEKIIGYKMGLTSKAKMKQMGVDSPIYGALTDAMLIQNGEAFNLAATIHPKIEPEIAFQIGCELKGDVSREQALAACEGVAAAMEIIDSRYRNFQFELPDVIADNCSGHAFVIGPMCANPSQLDLANLGMFMEVGGEAKLFGSSSAIYGDPLESLRELCRMLGRRGRALPAGSIVLAGAATAAISLERGKTYRACVQDLSLAELRAR